MGYFFAEKDLFDDISKSTGTNGCRHPLTFLLEAADDIAYKTADIEDAVKKGCITYKHLLEELKSDEAFENNDVYKRLIDTLEYRYKKAVDNDYERPDFYAVQNWVIGIQGQMLLKKVVLHINIYLKN